MLRQFQKILCKISLQAIFFVLAGLWLFVINCSILIAANEETVFTYRSPESENDARYDYNTSLLRLALESTIDSDGPYQLIPSPVMNYTRAALYVENNTYPNFFIKLSYKPEHENRNMSYVPFPVDLGIVGYRVCFAHPEVIEKLSKVETIQDLQRFTHGQGHGWMDREILRHNGFNVTVVAQYESLFWMVAKRRFDLFCRGANELFEEFRAHQHIQGLAYDKSIAISYPLPRFFYTNSKNVEALDRIHRGIIKAYNNGSLEELWIKHYKKSIDFSQLGRRKNFRIENPFVKELDFDYSRFFFNPME